MGRMKTEAGPSGASGVCVLCKPQLDPRKAGLISPLQSCKSQVGWGQAPVLGSWTTQDRAGGGGGGRLADLRCHSLIQPKVLEPLPRAGHWVGWGVKAKDQTQACTHLELIF